MVELINEFDEHKKKSGYNLRKFHDCRFNPNRIQWKNVIVCILATLCLHIFSDS